jgi:hypothetical protein
MIAALATTVPVGSFKVVANGSGLLMGPCQIVRYPRGPGGTTVTLNEYASADDGMLQVELERKGKFRVAAPTRLGGPKAPVNPLPVRVSTTRQGVIATNTSELAGVCA